MDDRLLAARLIERGLIAPQALAQVQAQLQPGQPLAQALVARRLVAPATLAALAAAPSHSRPGAPHPGATPGTSRFPNTPGSSRFPNTPGSSRFPNTPGSSRFPNTPGSSRFTGRTPSSRSGSRRNLPEVGELIDDLYEVTGRLGKGGMGVVFKGRELSTDRPVAIKMLLPGKTSSAHVARFKREAQVAARLEHAGVIPVHTSGERNGCPYYVMDYVEGRDLQQLFSDPEPPGYDEVVRLVEDVCRTMSICHDAGILHRDLKPPNVMVRASDGRALVADFGLARDDNSDRLTRTGQFMGTPGYIALEQIQDAKHSDHRADVYSLGAILFHGLAGEAPFQGTSLEQLFTMFAEDPPKPSQRRPGVPKDLDAICFKALARHPEDRYQTAREMADDLARWREGERVLASRASALFNFGRKLRRRDRKAVMMIAPLAGLLLVGLVSALVYAVWIRPRQAANETLAAYRDFDGGDCDCPESHPLKAYALGLGGVPAPERDVLVAWLERLDGATAALETTSLEAAQRARARIAAHLRLLDHLEGGDVDVPVREQADRDTTDLLVDAIVLLERDRPQRALARVTRAAERGELKGTVALLRVALWEAVLSSERADEAAGEFFVYLQQLEAEGRHDELTLARDQAAQAIRNRYLALVRGAPEVPRDQTRDALQRLLERSADPALGLVGQPLVDLLAEAKVAALEETAGAWRALLEAGAAEGREHARLDPVRHLGLVVRSAPAVTPGPSLHAVLDERVELAVRAYDEHDGGRKHELALRAVGLESAIFYGVDPSHVQGADYGRLVRYVVSIDSYGNHVDADAILAQLRTDPTRNIWETFLVLRFDPADLKELLNARPDSQALVYCLLMLVQRSGSEASWTEEYDQVELSDRLERVLAEGVPDLRFNYLAYAYVTLARTLLSRMRGQLVDPTPREQLAARIEAAVDRARETCTEGQVLGNLLAVWAQGRGEMGGREAEAEAWDEAVRIYREREQAARDDPVATDWDNWKADLLYTRAIRVGSAINGPLGELAVRAIREAVEATHAYWEPERSLKVRVRFAGNHLRARRFDEAEAVLAPRLEDGYSNLPFAQLVAHVAALRQDGAALRERCERGLAAHPGDPLLLSLQARLPR